MLAGAPAVLPPLQSSAPQFKPGLVFFLRGNDKTRQVLWIVWQTDGNGVVTCRARGLLFQGNARKLCGDHLPTRLTFLTNERDVNHVRSFCLCWLDRPHQHGRVAEHPHAGFSDAGTGEAAGAESCGMMSSLLRTWPSKLPPMKSGAMILCNVATSPFASAASQSLSNCATCSSGFVEILWANPHNAVPRHTNARKTARLTEIMSAPLSTADRHRRWSECSRLFRANTCLRKQRWC